MHRLLRIILYLALISSIILAFVFAHRLRDHKGVTIDYARPNGVPIGAYIGNIKSKKYAFPWCYGAEILKRENRVVFKSKSEAEGRGYIKSKVCSGLK